MLLTKLHIPTVNPNQLRRSSLFDHLDKGLEAKLTLVSAPAGSGKTSLISDWVRSKKYRILWLSLDKNDKDPSLFLGYIVQSFQKTMDNFGGPILQLLKSHERPSNEALIHLLINEIVKLKEDYLLVLDDFHLAETKEIAELTSYLLEHIPENFHILISTRSDPMLHMAKLRSQRQLVELRFSDLAFSVDEISGLFSNKLKIKLSDYDAQLLESKTEGWISGLQLVALSLEGQSDTSKFIRDLSGENRYIMDYLIEEVLNALSIDLKEFLLQTSILEKFSSQLCNKLLGIKDSQSILEKLEKRNLFIVPLDNERKWFRYQHLFADLLKQRLLLKGSKIVGDLHRKSVECYEEEEMHDLALEHSLATKNHTKSVVLAEKVVEEMWKDGQHSAILDLGDMVPQNIYEKHPKFCMYYAWALFNAGKMDRAHFFIEQASNKTAHIANQEGRDELLGKIAITKAQLNVNRETPDQILEYCSSALRHLSDEDTLWLGWTWKLKGLMEIASGNVEGGIEALIRTVEFGKRTSNLYLTSSAALALAYYQSTFGQQSASYRRCGELLHYMKEEGYSELAKSEWMYAGLFSMMAVRECIITDFDKALESVKIAYSLCKHEKNVTQKIVALLAYSYILYARGNENGARSKIQELEAVMKRFKISPYINTTYVGWKLYLLIDSKQLAEAQKFADASGLRIDCSISLQNELSYLNFTRLLIAQGQLVTHQSCKWIQGKSS